jgi:DNA-binding NtrC family response regulator
MKNDLKPVPAVLLVQKDGDITSEFLSACMQLADRPLLTNSGKKAIDLMDEDDSISLVFIAIDLPGINGIETVSRIRNRNETIPIVLLTHYMTIETLKVAMACGCNEVLQEPVTQTMMVSLLNKYLNTNQV